MLASQKALALGRAVTTGEKYSTVTTYSYDPRASRADVMMARNWTDDDRDYPRKGRGASIGDDEAVEELDGSEWDEVADVICAGRGRLGLAVAVAAHRAGLDVMLTDGPGLAVENSAAEAAGHLAGLLGITDEETVRYLQALTEDVTPAPSSDPTLPVRVVDGPIHPDLTHGPIETFRGAALMNWAESCLASAYGSLYTRVADPNLSVTYTGVNGPVDATVLDTIDIDPERPADSLEYWLSTLERDYGDELPRSGSLQRLVFENGVVMGAVVETSSGVRTVRARHGVMMALGDGLSPSGVHADLNRCEPAEVAMVSRAASRFARLELFTRALR